MFGKVLELHLLLVLVVWNLLFTEGFISMRNPKRDQRVQLQMGQARFKNPRKQNVEGNLYVDESCIDCDVCRWMCPSVFSRKGIQSAVHHQPESESEKLRAYAAMVSCPVGSIRTYEPDPLAKEAQELFPATIDRDRIPQIFHLGYHSVDSFGAAPYLIRRPPGESISKTAMQDISEGLRNEELLSIQGYANIMIDSPRYNSKLARAIEDVGGVVMMILTHKDDIADHKKWKERFPQLIRVIQRYDLTKDTEDCEVILQGEGPWQVAPDLKIIHTPGHTAGCICILHTPEAVDDGYGENVLFTGDHIAYSRSKEGLDGFKQYNKGSIDTQIESMRLLASEELQFLWIIPGHGRMVRFNSLQEKSEAILAATDRFAAADGSFGVFGIGY